MTLLVSHIAGNSWGVDPNGEGCLGCGNQETFRACADVTILSTGEPVVVCRLCCYCLVTLAFTSDISLINISFLFWDSLTCIESVLVSVFVSVLVSVLWPRSRVMYSCPLFHTRVRCSCCGLTPCGRPVNRSHIRDQVFGDTTPLNRT